MTEPVHTHPPITGPLVPEELIADWQNCPVCWPPFDEAD